MGAGVGLGVGGGGGGKIVRKGEFHVTLQYTHTHSTHTKTNRQSGNCEQTYEVETTFFTTLTRPT